MITPTQNAIVLSKIEDRNHQEQIFELIREHHLDNNTTEQICNIIADLEREANECYEDGYSDGQEDSGDEF